MGPTTQETAREQVRRAWNRQAVQGCEWSQPVSPEVIARARKGDFSVRLTVHRDVPRAWFPADLGGVRVLCLASGGGQQAPVLAAAGALVTSFDLSPQQLRLDGQVAAREGLSIRLIEGDACDLSSLATGSFDLVVNPCSNCFMADLWPVWSEVARVLRPGGTVMSGWVQPVAFAADEEDLQTQAKHAGPLTLRYRLPYSDPEQRTPEELDAMEVRGEPWMFGHTLEQQIGWQCQAGLALIGLYEDRWGDRLIDQHLASFAATLARKLPAM